MNMRNNKITRNLIMIVFSLVVVVAMISCSLGPSILDGLKTTKIDLSGKSMIEVGEILTVTAKISPETDEEYSFVWSTSNSNVLSVDQNGVVTGVNEGTASIICKTEENENIAGRLYIKVKKQEIVYTDDAPETITLKGDSQAYVGTVGYYRFTTTPLNASQDISFVSSNEEIATVDDFGVVKFKTAGNVIITAVSEKDNNITGSINVNVLVNNRSESLETATIEVIKNTKDSILGVATYEYNDNGVLVKVGIGSGFVYNVYGIDAEGNTIDVVDGETENISKYIYYLITNRHVIEGSDQLKVYLHTIDEEINATLIHFDEKVDLALVKFEYEEYIKPLKFSNSDNLVHGETVIAMGNPESFDFSSSATRGIISYPERFINDDTDGDGVNDWDAVYIQHDASINPGNSGGPLLNMYGDVVGINTLKFASANIDNMGFSIPSNTIVELLPYLEKGKVPERAKIGVTIVAIRDLLSTDFSQDSYQYEIPEDVKYGLYVTGITSGSVCDGILMQDDIMLEFNGTILKSSLSLRAELNRIIVGANTEILVKVLRDGKIVEVVLVF